MHGRGDRIDFQGDVATKVANLVMVKCLINRTISTPGAKAACIDMKDFYLNNPLPSPEYVRFSVDTIPPETWEQDNLEAFMEDRWVYAQVDKRLHGLPQAGRVASDHLIPHLTAARYKEAGRTPGLFCHTTNGTILVLVIDGFLVHYTSDTALQHLTSILKDHYTITIDAQATKFCVMTLEWNYGEGHVTLSMPGYVEKALQRFTHPTPTKPQHAPHPWTPPDYGARVQYAEPKGPWTSKKLHAPTNYWYVPILCPSHRQYPPSSIGNLGSSANQRHRKNNGCHHTSLKLCSNQPRRSHTISPQRHGIVRPQQCLLSE